MHLKVLQWNVWYKEKIERVLGELKKHDADIICLQELTKGYIEQTHENTWEFIGHQLGYQYHYQEIPIITADMQWTQANAIFSKYPIVGKMNAWLHEPEDPEDPGDQFRGYLEITIEASGQHITIATTHLSFSADGHPKAYDPELQRLLQFAAFRPERYILTGDMNATPQNPRITELLRHLQHAGPPFSQNTWTTKPYIFNDVPVTTLDWRYDYIFSTRDLRAVHASVLKTDVSDHLPLMATFRLNEAKSL